MESDVKSAVTPGGTGTGIGRVAGRKPERPGHAVRPLWGSEAVGGVSVRSVHKAQARAKTPIRKPGLPGAGR